MRPSHPAQCRDHREALAEFRTWTPCALDQKQPHSLDSRQANKISGGRLLRRVLECLFLELLDGAESLMGRPAVSLHQLLHKNVRTIGNRRLDIGHFSVVPSKSGGPKRSKLLCIRLIHPCTLQISLKCLSARQYRTDEPHQKLRSHLGAADPNVRSLCASTGRAVAKTGL